MREIFSYVFLAGALLATSTAAGQDRLRLERADVGKNEVINGETVQILIGNVLVQQGEITLHSDRVTHYINRGIWTFEGDVLIHDSEKDVRSQYIIYDVGKNLIQFRTGLEVINGETVLTARRGIYYPDLQKYSCAGNVRFQKEMEQLDADSAEYFEKENIVKVYDNVIYHNEKERVRLSGGYGIFYADKEYTMITDNPSINFKDSSDGESAWIYGKTVEQFGEEKKILVTDSVRIYRGKLSAVCDTAHYYKNSDEAFLSGSPVIYSSRSVIVGETISLFFQGNTIEHMTAEGKAKATMPVEGIEDNEKRNELQGSTIIISFKDNEIQHMMAKRNAQSRYYVIEGRERRGANLVRGETITLSFSDGEMQKVVVDGGSEGLFYPPGMEYEMENQKERKGP